MSVLSTDLKNRIHRALEQTEGNRRKAAEILGWSYETLKNKIYSCVDLKARWTHSETSETTEPPSEVECISPNPLNAVLLEKQQEMLAEMMRREDEKLRTGLAGLGLDADEVKLAVELQAFNRDHFARSIDIISAGVTRTALKLQTRMDKIAKRVEYVSQQIEAIPGMTDERVAWVEEEKGLLEQYQIFADQLRKIMGQGYEAAKITALVRQRQSKKAKVTPGFQPAIPV